MNDVIKLYQSAIRELEKVASDKKATVNMLMDKHQPSGAWDHGEELLSLEKEVEMVKAKLFVHRNHLKVLKEAELMENQSKDFLAGNDQQLF